MDHATFLLSGSTMKPPEVLVQDRSKCTSGATAFDGKTVAVGISLWRFSEGTPMTVTQDQVMNAHSARQIPLGESFSFHELIQPSLLLSNARMQFRRLTILFFPRHSGCRAVRSLALLTEPSRSVRSS